MVIGTIEDAEGLEDKFTEISGEGVSGFGPLLWYVQLKFCEKVKSGIENPISKTVSTFISFDFNVLIVSN